MFPFLTATLWGLVGGEGDSVLIGKQHRMSTALCLWVWAGAPRHTLALPASLVDHGSEFPFVQ